MAIAHGKQMPSPATSWVDAQWWRTVGASAPQTMQMVVGAIGALVGILQGSFGSGGVEVAVSAAEDVSGAEYEFDVCLARRFICQGCGDGFERGGEVAEEDPVSLNHWLRSLLR
jgi:hypothetical protein